MSRPRTNLVDLANEVAKMMELQQAYFKARKAGFSDTRKELEESKKQERYVSNLVVTIKRDHAEIAQAKLFDAPGPTTVEGVTDPCLLAHHYGEYVTAEVQPKDSMVWVPSHRMYVGAILIRHAELGRIRNFQVQPQRIDNLYEKEATNV